MTDLRRAKGFGVCAWERDRVPVEVMKVWMVWTQYAVRHVLNHPGRTTVLIPGAHGWWVGAPRTFVEGERFLVDMLADRLSVDGDETILVERSPDDDPDSDWILFVTYAEISPPPLQLHNPEGHT